MKKILVSDYDRTFFVNDEGIKINIEKVKEFRDSGNIFVVATGRSYYDFGIALGQYDIDYDYLIIDQGGTILDKNHKMIVNYPIDDDVKYEILQEYQIKDDDTTFASKELVGRVSVDNQNLTKINKRYGIYDLANSVCKNVNEKFGDKVNCYLLTNSKSIEIISSMTNKAKAIEVIAEMERVDEQYIYSVGDSFNDIEMLDKFNGYCMASGDEALKSRYDNQVNSVAELIDIVLKEND